MHKLGTSSTNYFNKKYNRSGSLFQGPYKAIHIDSNDYLLWLSGYVNGNIEIHQLGKAEIYPWSSYKSFLEEKKDEILGDISIILSQFDGAESYKNFARIIIQESRNKKEMEKYLLEELKKGA
jgi:putative transposase